MLHLKEDAGEFLSEASLTSLIHRYSEFITFPIFQLVEKEEEVEVDEEEEEEEEAEATGESCIQVFVVVAVGREYVPYRRPVSLGWSGTLLAHYASFSVAHAGKSVVLGASRPLWPLYVRVMGVGSIKGSNRGLPVVCFAVLNHVVL